MWDINHCEVLELVLGPHFNEILPLQLGSNSSTFCTTTSQSFGCAQNGSIFNVGGEILKIRITLYCFIDLKGMSFDGILGMSLQDSTNGPLNISQNNNGTAPLNMPILQMLKNANICENQIFSLYLRRISHSNNSTGGQLTLCGINPQHYKVCNYFNLIISEK